jgi:hypothetical protein
MHGKGSTSTFLALLLSVSIRFQEFLLWEVKREADYSLSSSVQVNYSRIYGALPP